MENDELIYDQKRWKFGKHSEGSINELVFTLKKGEDWKKIAEALKKAGIECYIGEKNENRSFSLEKVEKENMAFNDPQLTVGGEDAKKLVGLFSSSLLKEGTPEREVPKVLQKETEQVYQNAGAEYLKEAYENSPERMDKLQKGLEAELGKVVEFVKALGLKDKKGVEAQAKNYPDLEGVWKIIEAYPSIKDKISKGENIEKGDISGACKDRISSSGKVDLTPVEKKWCKEGGDLSETQLEARGLGNFYKNMGVAAGILVAGGSAMLALPAVLSGVATVGILASGAAALHYGIRACRHIMNMSKGGAEIDKQKGIDPLSIHAAIEKVKEWKTKKDPKYQATIGAKNATIGVGAVVLGGVLLGPVGVAVGTGVAIDQIIRSFQRFKNFQKKQEAPVVGIPEAAFQGIEKGIDIIKEKIKAFPSAHNKEVQGTIGTGNVALGVGAFLGGVALGPVGAVIGTGIAVDQVIRSFKRFKNAQLDQQRSVSGLPKIGIELGGKALESLRKTGKDIANFFGVAGARKSR